MEGKTALIVGATGLVGSSCLKYLLEDNYYSKVIVLTRKSTQNSHPKLNEHIVDFDEIRKHDTQLIADHIFCCLGTTIKKAGTKDNFRKVDLEYPYELAKISLENNATQFNLVSALGADSNSRIFYNKVKGETEELISKLPFESVNIFQPSVLMGERKETRPVEKSAIKMMKFLRFLFVGALSKYKPVEAEKVAKAMVVNAKREVSGVHFFESDKIEEMV
jgi:uncharacterized protein YbjT (DUF2867 family)